jgi:hypothetical protein
MRIRRYAARLLSSSNRGSHPPHSAVPWHHAAADDSCAFCDLTHSSPQVCESPLCPILPLAALIVQSRREESNVVVLLRVAGF